MTVPQVEGKAELQKHSWKGGVKWETSCWYSEENKKQEKRHRTVVKAKLPIHFLIYQNFPRCLLSQRPLLHCGSKLTFIVLFITNPSTQGQKVQNLVFGLLKISFGYRLLFPKRIVDHSLLKIFLFLASMTPHSAVFLLSKASSRHFLCWFFFFRSRFQHFFPFFSTCCPIICFKRHLHTKFLYPVLYSELKTATASLTAPPG